MDSMLSSREGSSEDSSHGTLTSLKTTIMQEWDGLSANNERVVVIGSTNRPFDLDEAVLRRLPRRIFVDLPDLASREAILNVSLARNAIAPDLNLTQVPLPKTMTRTRLLVFVAKYLKFRVVGDEAGGLHGLGHKRNLPRGGGLNLPRNCIPPRIIILFFC